MADDNDNDVVDSSESTIERDSDGISKVTEQLENSGAIGSVSDEAEDEDEIVATLDDSEDEEGDGENEEKFTSMDEDVEQNREMYEALADGDDE